MHAHLRAQAELPLTESSFYFPTPIPSSHEFFLSELDSKDGFVHLSTAQQVPGTLERFFAGAEQVAILRIEYARLSAWKRVRWEQAGNGECECRCVCELDKR